MTYKSIYSLTILILISSCKKTSVPINVTIRAVNERKKPITNAQVYVNKSFEGRSNSQGYLVFQKEFEPGERVFFEVRKESKNLYYAPYYENLVLSEDKKDLSIKATLYSVPKPGIEKSDEHSSEPLSSEDNPSTQEDISDENLVATDPESSLQVTDRPENQEKSSDLASEQTIESLEKQDPKRESPELSIATPVIANEEAGSEKKALPDTEILAPASNLATTSPPVLTFYVRGKGEPVSQAHIFYGLKKRGQLKEACITNKMGRCQLRGGFEPGVQYSYLVRKRDYISSLGETTFDNNGKIHRDLKPGHSIDVFALTNHYSYRRGLTKVTITIDKKKVGETDEFGFFSTTYRGKRGDLIEIGLKARQHLPQDFETDYIVGGNVSLVKYFSPISPEPVRVATMPAQIAGRLQGKTLSTFTGNLDQHLKSSLKRHFFNSSSFAAVNNELMLKKTDTSKMLRKIRGGWNDDEAKSEIDAVLLPTVVVHSPMTLELSLIDSSGTVLAAGKENFDSFSDRKAIQKSVEMLSKKILRRFPFEGSITDESEGLFTINLGFGEGHSVKPGDKFDVYGLQSDLKGQKKRHARIGSLEATQVREYSSRAKVLHTEARSIIDIGDQVVFRRHQGESGNKMTFAVTDPDQNRDLSQANIYFQGEWIGATDEDGRLLSSNHKTGRGLLKVIKHGYETFQKETKLGRTGKVEIPLKRVSAYLRIDTEPQNLSVFIDKKFVGKTPFEKPVAVPSGFVKLEILGEGGLKNFKQVLELEEGTLDLTGDRKITMEKDFRSKATQHVNSGRFQEAVQLLEEVPPQHSDYLHAQHQAGVIYMTLLNQAAKAAAAFHRVTNHPEVKSYRDKRFIGSHINEGVSLYLTGQSLLKEGNEDAAVPHFRKAIEVLTQAEPHIRFIKKVDYQQAFDNLFYYTAISHQELWSLTQETQHLQGAETHWRQLLANRQPEESKTPMIKNANVYLKQLEVALNRTKRQNL